MALKTVATWLILAYNHPINNLKPSEANRQLTERRKQVGKLMDIQVIDYLVLIEGGYFSFANEGILY